MRRPQTVLRSTLSRLGARSIAETALAEAMIRKVCVAIVVVDEAARPLVVEVMDGAPNASFEVAFAKARHAANFRRPTKFQEDLLLLEGKWHILAVPGMLPLDGGVPIQQDGAVVGAIGVSGAASSVDGEIAGAALDGAPP